MKMQILKTLSAGCILMGLAACSFNGDSTSDQTKNYLDDRSRILSTYTPILGTYEGQITAYVRSTADVTKFDKKIIKLQLAIYTQDVQNGNDPNGESKPLPTLVVRYRQLDIVRPDEMLNAARFVPESGELFATNSAASTPTTGGSTSNGSSSTNNGSYSICNSGGTVATTLNNAHVSGDTITGTILRGNGELGKFTATRTTNTTIVPATDPTTDCNDRLAVQFKAVAGVYAGFLTETAANGGAVVPVRMNLNYIPVASSNGSILATLIGSFQYNTTGDVSTTVPSMLAVFRTETTPAQLVMSYLTSGTGGGGFSLTGVLDGDTYTAEAYSGNLGDLGAVVVKKVSSQP